MNQSRIAVCAMFLCSATIVAVASPALAASAHNSQIGAAGPTTDPYSPELAQKPSADIVDYKVLKSDQKATVPCSSRDVHTELERRRCD